jgi:peptidoglycan/LPS O-acetylase OafA/YrhL
MPHPFRTRLSETQWVLAICSLVLAVSFVYESGFTKGLLRAVLFAGFVTQFAAGIAVAINVVLRQRIFTKSTVLLLLAGATISIAAVAYRGIDSAAWVAFGVVPGLFVGLIVGLQFKFRRKR